MNKLKRVFARMSWIDLALLVPSVIGFVIGGLKL